MVVSHRPQMTIRRMRFACWIIKPTDTHTHTHTHSVFNTYCFSTSTMFTRTRLITLNVHGLSCLFLNRATVTTRRKRDTCWMKNGYWCAAVCEWIIDAIRRHTAVPSKHIRPNPRVFCVSLIASLTLTLNAWLMEMCRDTWNTLLLLIIKS